MISRRRHLSLTLFICSFLSACASPKPLEMGGYMPAETGAKDGDGVAMTELQDAASGGNGAAEYALGLSLAEGWTGKKDLEQAFLWWQRAAEHGSPEAKNALAVAYAEGLNGPPNLALARGLWQQAAEQGNATAQYNLASLLVATAEDRSRHGGRRRLATTFRRAGRSRRSVFPRQPLLQRRRRAASAAGIDGCGDRRPRKGMSSPSSACRGHTSRAPPFRSTSPKPKSGCTKPRGMGILMRRSRRRCWRGGHSAAQDNRAPVRRSAGSDSRYGRPIRTFGAEVQGASCRSERGCGRRNGAGKDEAPERDEGKASSVGCREKDGQGSGKGSFHQRHKRVAATKVGAHPAAAVTKLARAEPAKPSAAARAQGITKRSSTTKGGIKQAAVPPRLLGQAKSPTSTKVPMPVRRHVAQAASKPKAR